MASSVHVGTTLGKAAKVSLLLMDQHSLYRKTAPAAQIPMPRILRTHLIALPRTTLNDAVEVLK